MFRGKCVVVGAGYVGSTTAYTLMLSGLFEEIFMIDLNREKAEGDALDISHGTALVKPTEVRSGGYDLCRDADVVIITAGAAQKPGETRLDLLKKNAEIMKDITHSVMEYAPEDVIILVVTNPVDILTYIVWKESGLPKNQVLGSGTVLDTARLKVLLSDATGIDGRNIHTYVVGEHGDSEVVAWNITRVGGMTVEEYFRQCPTCPDADDLEDIPDAVRTAAYEIIEKKGATYYAIAVAVRRIVEAIVHNERSILTVSSVLEGEYSLKDVCLSLPAIVGENGTEKVLEAEFSPSERSGISKSAETLSKFLREIGY